MAFRVSGSPKSLHQIVQGENRSYVVDFLFSFFNIKMLNIHRVERLHSEPA